MAGIIQSAGGAVNINGVNIDCNGFSVKYSRSQPMSWAVNTSNRNYRSDTFLPPKVEVEKPIPDKTCRIQLQTNDGISFDWQNLILLERNPVDETGSRNGAYSVNFSGNDFGKQLFADGWTLPTYKHSGGWYARNIIQDLASKAGFSGVTFMGDLNTYLDSSNFPVVQFAVQQDRLVNRIQTLLNECGAHWFVDNKQLICWIPETGTEDITLTEEDIYKLTVKESSQTLYDFVIVTRMSQNAGLAGAGEGTAPPGGRQDLSLSGIFYSCQLHLDDGHNCQIESGTVDWYLSGGYVGNGISFVGPADEVLWTPLPIASGNFGWKVSVNGIPEEYHSTGVDLDTKVELTIPGTSGKNKAPQITSNLTPNNTIATLKGNAFLREQGYLKEMVTVETRLTDEIDLTKRVKIQHGAFDIDDVYYVDGYSINFDGIIPSMSLDLVRYIVN